MRQEIFNNPRIKPETFSIPVPDELPLTQKKLDEEMAQAWKDLQEIWDEVDLHKMDITEARKKWILPFFRTLGFTPVYQPQDIITSGDDRLKFHISHRGFPQERDPMIHTVSPSDDLDVRNASDRNKKSPHDTLQRYLNVEKKAQWGLLTNGIILRLLRDFYHTSTKGYVEFDLQNIFTDRSFSDFRALYRLLHASRFFKDKEGIIPLEHFFNESRAAGVKVGEDLQGNVKKAIETLGNGFLTGELAQRMISDEKFCHEYYEELLHVIYRILFMLFAEQRGMLPSRDSLYAEEYSITKLRELSETFKGKDKHADLWYGLKVTFRLLKIGSPKLRVFPYNGSLFDDERIKILSSHSCTNENLLIALKYLTLIEKDRVSQRISYLDLGVEEIGSIYESLLDFTPRVIPQDEEIEGELIHARTFFLDPRGTARKTTGSYYTNPLLVDELIKSALIPVVQKKIAAGKTPLEMEKLLLALKICDLSCGSAAFLIAAVNYMGRELAKIRTGNDYPSDKEERRAKRDVLQHCIYGVDLNPMAVELAKVSLWINCAVEDLPLSFLDHHIKCGNSLIGTTPDLLLKGIPDEAFTPVEGDDKKVAKEIMTINKAQKKSQSLASWGIREDEKIDTEKFIKLSDLPEDKPEGVAKKEDCYNQLTKSYTYSHQKLLADAWTAAFFWPLAKETKDAPTQGVLRMLHEGDSGAVDKKIVDRVKALAQEYRFFHWYLEFPEVFQREEAGFDCMIGNPPWERVKLQEEEFFEYRNNDIASALNKSKRDKLIQLLQNEKLSLYQEFKKALRDSNVIGKFFRESGRFQLSAKGDLNYYPLFAEFNKTAINRRGKVGMVIASGIATDFFTKDFFQDIINNKRLLSLYDFENREALFPGIHRQYKFSLLSLTGKDMPAQETDFAFFLTNLDQLKEGERHFTLTDKEIELLNPNTRTCPIFRSKKDAELTKKIYRKHPVLIKEIPNKESQNILGISFLRMFDMSTDSHLFKTRGELENMGFELNGNIFRKPEETYLPLYEGKTIWNYDHRFAEFSPDAKGYGTIEATIEKHADPTWEPLPRYWIGSDKMREKKPTKQDWFLGFRRFTNSTNMRTSVFTIVPAYAFTDTAPIIYTRDDPSILPILCMLLSSFVCDYLSRQKIGGVHLDFHFLQQFPIPNIKNIGQNTKQFILGKLMILFYTSNSLTPFAHDMGYNGPPFVWNHEEREQLKAELDAIAAHLYGVTNDELDYILDTFPIVKRKDEAKYGEYRTKRMILEYYEKYKDMIVKSGI